jgi:kynurenine formamidase
MARKYLFLGFPLTPDSPSPPAIPPIKLSPFLTIEKDEANVTMMELTSHTGTHLDTPGHVIQDGLLLTDFGAEDFVFSHPFIADLPLGDTVVVQPEHLEPFAGQGKDADLLLFRFGYGPVRRSDPERFSKKSPGFGVESAQYLRTHFPKMRALGMDVPSLSCIEHLDVTFRAHHALLGGPGRKFLVIEDMNLEEDLSELTEVVVAPLLVERIDGCPCTILGILGS